MAGDRRLSTEEKQMLDIWKRALSNPQGTEKQELFRTLTESSLPFDPRQRQFARDRLGPDTRTVRMELASRQNPRILSLFRALYPNDKFLAALQAGLK